MPNWKAGRMRQEAAMLPALSSELARNEKKRARNASCLRLPSDPRPHRSRRPCARHHLRRAARGRNPARKREQLPPERLWPRRLVLALSASCSHLADRRGQSLRWIDPTPLDVAVHGAVAGSRASVAGAELFHQRCARPEPDEPSTQETFLYTAAMVPFLHFGRLLVPTFGLMIAAAMVVAYYVLRADFARRGLAAKDSTTAEMFVAVPALCGIVGAKLYHVLETPRELLADPLGQLFSRYGLAWFGGLIAGFAAFMWLARRFRYSLLEVFDAGSAAAGGGYGVGRIGCLLSGDGDYGVPTSLPWGMSFPNGLVPTTQRVHPTPIYELIVALLIAAYLWRRGAKSEAPPRLGQITGEYLVLSGVARFLVEFIRINPRIYWGMSNAQVASLGSIAAGVLLVVWARRHSVAPAAGAAEVAAAASRH